ncbi:MAG: SGNH/GDSL hydrolase family protein [Pseudomonadota bacterium]
MFNKNNFITKHPKLANLILLLVVSAISLAALFGIAKIEIFQDFSGGEKYSLSDKVVYALRCNNRRHIKLRELSPNQDLIRTPIQKYDTLEYKKYHLRTDKDGIIQPSFVHKDPDLQMFFLGGSTTECEMVDEEFRFPYLAGRKLEEALKIKVNSDNAARSGNNSLHSIDILLNKLLPYNPDIVVMMQNINDLSTLIYEGTYWNNNKTISPIDCGQKNTSKIRRSSDEWDGSIWYNRVIANKKEQDRLVEQFRENLQLFINICRAKNIIPVLLTQPNRVVKDHEFSTGRGKNVDKIYKELYARFSNTIKQIGIKENVLVIDLEKKVPSDKKYIYDVVHVNKEGSIMEAKEISHQLAIYLQKIHFKPNTKLSTSNQ